MAEANRVGADSMRRCADYILPIIHKKIIANAGTYDDYGWIESLASAPPIHMIIESIVTIWSTKIT